MKMIFRSADHHPKSCFQSILRFSEKETKMRWNTKEHRKVSKKASNFPVSLFSNGRFPPKWSTRPYKFGWSMRIPSVAWIRIQTSPIGSLAPGWWCTLPETNMTPGPMKNRPFGPQKEAKKVFQPTIFSGDVAVSFRAIGTRDLQWFTSILVPLELPKHCNSDNSEGE